MMGAQSKAQRGLAMEGFIASWYARQTAREADDFKRLARRIAAHVGSGSRVLEVAPGPGYLAIELAKLHRLPDYRTRISRSFVSIATENARKAGVRVDFEHGDAADLPFPAEQFDFIVCVRRSRILPSRLSRSMRCTARSRPAARRSLSICARTFRRRASAIMSEAGAGSAPLCQADVQDYAEEARLYQRGGDGLGVAVAIRTR
jgi:2-polyprenyl-3-methyl-5-hydroxy-6-metoxy-1,4-benzoquinol methylase